ncbi:MAG TPA: drug/metabolite exporter YedA [Myxococcales bacterium]|nr:drug/metabolite exporter YedA [Myxococcales bacterium]
MKTDRGRILLAMGALYLIWGSTYLAIRYALQGYPPFLLAGVRYLAAGLIAYAIALARGAAHPTRTQWRSALVVGTLLVFGNACVVLAEQWVASGIAAVAIASVPLWVALFAGLFGRWPSRGEWVALAVGLGGVALLQSGGEMRASPAGAMVLTLSCVTWSLGSIYSGRLPLPKGLMSSAAQMLAGGAVLTAVAVVRGERITQAPPAHATLALAYLSVFGSVIAYTAYQFLLQRVRPTLATSYAYVNPVVAVGLGAAVAGEAVAPRAIGALALILGGVAMLAVVTSRRPA